MTSTRSNTGRRPRGHSDETRRDILYAAMEVFGEHGYRQGSLQEIGDRVGMTHSGVLHHFGSKNNLLLEVVKFRDQTDLEQIDANAVPRGMEFFRHLIRTVKMNSRRPGVVQMYAVLSADSVTEGHPAKAYFIERFRNLRADTADAVNEIAPAGSLAPGQAEIAATAILGGLDGIEVQWLLDKDAVDLVASSSLVINSVLKETLGDSFEGIDPCAVED